MCSVFLQPPVHLFWGKDPALPAIRKLSFLVRILDNEQLRTRTLKNPERRESD